MKKYLMFLFLVLPVLQALAQDTPPCGDKLTDPRDQKVYNTVQIGDQCWMRENLNTGQQVNDMKQTDNGKIEKTCYQNDPANCDTYGGLYTWNEAMQYDPSNKTGICPPGWHIPTNQEWTVLNTFLGIDMSGQKMKVTRDHDPSWDGNNESGFTALPAGSGYENSFGRKGFWALFWTSTERDGEYAWFTQLDNYWAMNKYTILYQGNYYLKKNGFSVRCIKNTD